VLEGASSLDSVLDFVLGPLGVLMHKMQKQAGRYALGILAAAIALFLRWLLDPLMGVENPYHTAWLAVVFAGWYCGVGPAIATTILSLAGVWFFFLPPVDTFRGVTYAQFFGMAGFLVLSAAIITLGESSRRAMAKRLGAEEELRRLHEELENAIRERTAALGERTAALGQKTEELAEKATMLDLANDAIFVRTAADTISYWNEGAERLYGWTREEVIGHSPHDFLRTEFPVPLSEIKSQETWQGEIRHFKRDGSQIIVASRWRTLRDGAGNALGWLEINTDITSRKRAEEAARSLSGRLLTLQDEERRRIARELHDSLGQYLAALKMNIECLPSTNGEQIKILADCSRILEKCLTEVRTISHLLHPPLLDESGLPTAARWYVDEFARRSGIVVEFDVSPEQMRLRSETELALFRAIQEALTNVHRHSRATAVKIRLTRVENTVNLEIKDNGRGIPQEQLSRLAEGTTEVGVGLAGMRERLREFDGSLEIQSGGTGTRVLITAPFVERDASESGILVA
jgi:PAS domain S-box-containing protein